MHRLSFTSEHRIDAPPERVFEAMTNPEGFGDWMKGFVRAERLTPGEFGVGTTFRETRKMFGKEATEHFEVTTCVPGKRLGLKVDGTKGTTGKGEYRFDYDFEPAGTGTLVRTSAVIDMPGGLFTKIMGKLMGGAFKKACDKDLDALKTYMERGR
ncbi:SRPBCC family protein [Polyangium mundeleinium]|uniref:SRPBCC family protein n=1 Tax=Polyangium mundeleinium TaxID=2995306 RepID=A0ABT5EQU2_9BACT|nr:SRPBCC family protein [Polyangium mundeleinium]MDC0743553.1 SRPBCC family protein [Polyangium mundeleinium]